VVSDISCDVHGGIEFLERSTTIDQPSFQYDPITGKERRTTTTSDDNDDSNCITVMGVDILPTELPLESSTHFGNAVRDLLDEFVQAKKSTTTTAAAAAADINGVLDIDKLSPSLVRTVHRLFRTG
jgi:alpha-aminoadipic semialdehyde synthase